MAYHQILVTLDGSKLAELALKQAAQVAAPGAHIHILSILAEDNASEIAALSSATAYASPTVEWPQTGGVSDPHSDNAREAYLEQISEWLLQAELNVTIEVYARVR